MPTSIGNILRAAERRPADKYGLDAIIVWPRLWLLLPEATRTELRAAYGSLDLATATVIWGVLFCAFAPFTWLAVPAGAGGGRGHRVDGHTRACAGFRRPYRGFL